MNKIYRYAIAGRNSGQKIGGYTNNLPALEKQLKKLESTPMGRGLYCIKCFSYRKPKEISNKVQPNLF